MQWRIWESYCTDSVGTALRLDSLRSSHPIQVPIAHAEEVEEVFDGISYNKGSSVINMIYKVLGPEHFRKGLQLYFKRHQYGNTETVDLWAAWSEVSGIELADLMSSWTCKMGHPFLSVKNESWTAGELTLTLEQRWFLSDGSGSAEDALWNIPLINATGTESRVVQKSLPFFAKSREFTTTIALPTPSSWVKLNNEQSALVRVSHSEEMISRLTPAVTSKALGAIDRAYLLEDQYASAVAGLAPIELTAKLLPAYSSEDNNAVWKSIQSTFNGLKQGMEGVGGEAYIAFEEFSKQIVLKALGTFGWNHLEGEEDTRKEVRAIIISLVASFCTSEASVVAKAKELFEAYCVSKDDKILPSDFRGAVYRIVLQAGDEREFDIVMQQYKVATDDESRRSICDCIHMSCEIFNVYLHPFRWAISTLGYASSPELKLRVMQWAISGDVKLQDCYSPMLSVSR